MIDIMFLFSFFSLDSHGRRRQRGKEHSSTGHENSASGHDGVFIRGGREYHPKVNMNITQTHTHTDIHIHTHISKR